MKATLLRTDGTSESIIIPDWKGGYDGIKAAVKPFIDNFEHVSVWHDGKRTDMFVDEDGHGKMLHRNDAATEIYRAATMAGKTGHPVPDDPETLPWIAGDAVLFDERVWF